MTITVAAVIHAVAECYGVTDDDLKSQSRRPAVTFPRHVAMYLARELTGRAYARIGYLLGQRDHSTAIHGYRRIEKLRTQPEVAEAIRQISLALASKTMPGHLDVPDSVAPVDRANAWRDADEAFLTANWACLTDEQIAQRLSPKRTAAAVARRRGILGLWRGSPRPRKMAWPSPVREKPINRAPADFVAALASERAA